MTRKLVLAALKAAGTDNDQQAFLRLYTENRVSYAAAMEAFRAGQWFRTWVDARDGKIKLT